MPFKPCFGRCLLSSLLAANLQTRVVPSSLATQILKSLPGGGTPSFSFPTAAPRARRGIDIALSPRACLKYCTSQGNPRGGSCTCLAWQVRPTTCLLQASLLNLSGGPKPRIRSRLCFRTTEAERLLISRWSSRQGAPQDGEKSPSQHHQLCVSRHDGAEKICRLPWVPHTVA